MQIIKTETIRDHEKKCKIVMELVLEYSNIGKYDEDEEIELYDHHFKDFVVWIQRNMGRNI